MSFILTHSHREPPPEPPPADRSGTTPGTTSTETDPDQDRNHPGNHPEPPHGPTGNHPRFPVGNRVGPRPVPTDVDRLLAEVFATATPPVWHRDAACREHPELTWFPDRGDDTSAQRAVCAGCLVRGECEAYAITIGERHGLWGGLSERERRRLRGPATTRSGTVQ